VRKYCDLVELTGIEYIGNLAKNDIFIPIISFDLTCTDYGWYETPLGQKAQYTDAGLLKWLPYCYKELKRLDISHNDIMLQNIVVLPGNDYRLIDFETVRPGGGSFHDWCKINQLMTRILNNTSSNRGAYQNNESFFRQ